MYTASAAATVAVQGPLDQHVRATTGAATTGAALRPIFMRVRRSILRSFEAVAQWGFLQLMLVFLCFFCERLSIAYITNPWAPVEENTGPHRVTNKKHFTPWKSWKQDSAWNRSPNLPDTGLRKPLRANRRLSQSQQLRGEHGQSGNQVLSCVRLRGQLGPAQAVKAV